MMKIKNNRLILFLSILFLLLISSALFPQEKKDQNLFTNPATGISIKKPYFARFDRSIKNKLTDKNLLQIIKKEQTVHIVSIIRQNMAKSYFFDIYLIDKHIGDEMTLLEYIYEFVYSGQAADMIKIINTNPGAQIKKLPAYGIVYYDFESSSLQKAYAIEKDQYIIVLKLMTYCHRLIYLNRIFHQISQTFELSR